MSSYMQWLQQVSLSYPDPNRTVQQVDVVLSRVKSLKPKTDNFTRMAPHAPLLICLFGPMDLNFQGNPFSISIEVWLPTSFPFQPPMVYVVTNGQQRLRPSNLVDPAGRVMHSYLSYWHTRPNSTLIEMMNYLHQAFCQEPPVFLDAPRPAAPPASKSVSPAPPPPRASANVLQLREKLKKKALDQFNLLQEELAVDTDRILAENTMLSEGEGKIKKAQGNLRAEILKVTDEVQQSKARRESLQEMIVQLQSGEEVDILKLLIPQGAISRQIVREITQELTYQDCIYALSKAFEKGAMDLPGYLRIVRDQAKKEFMAKAILLKIREQFPTD